MAKIFMGQSKLFSWKNKLSISQKLYLVIGIMVIFISIELLAIWFSLSALSSIRAYVGGEGLWSKSQKNAIYYLQEYAYKGNETDYESFNTFMKVPLGDRTARIELEKQNSNNEIARNGFLNGGNHPNDIEGMMHTFKRFRNIYYIDKAITIWTEADIYLLKQISICEQIHQEYKSATPSKTKINNLLLEARIINSKLTKLEEEFSYILGEGSRWLENIVLYTLLLTAFTAEITCLILIVSVINGITKGVHDVIRVSKLAAVGDFSERANVYTDDEIGQLATTFNNMIASTGTNLHELKSAEKQIREREQQINIIFNCSPDGVVVLDIDGRITNWNPKATEIFGWSNQEAIGSIFSELIKFPDIEQNQSGSLGRFFPSEQSLTDTQTIETSSFKKNGASLQIILSMAPTVILDKHYRVCFIKDITEKQIARLALETETRYVKLLQTIAEASNESASLTEAGQIALEKICEIIKWPIGHMLIKNATNKFTSSGVWSISQNEFFNEFIEKTKQVHSFHERSLLGKVESSKKAVWISNIELPELSPEIIANDSNLSRLEAAKKIGLKSAFAFPIMIKDEVVALLEFFSIETFAPNYQLLEIVGNIGKQLGRVEERQRANDEIKASEEKLRALTETAIDSIISSDSHGNIIYFNSGAEKTFGYSSAEILGKSLTMIMPETMQAAHTTGMERYMMTRQAHVVGKTTELIGRKKNGVNFPLELTLSTWQAKGETFFTGVMRDITERKNKDEELLKLSAVASYTNNAVVITDKTGKIEWVNDGFTRLSGYTLNEIQEKYKNSVSQFIDEDTFNQINSNTPVSYEIKSISKDGKEYWVLATLTPILDANGQLQKIIVIDSDITIQKATQTALIKAKKIAENSERTKEMFLANMSHEIRTPMNAIIGFTRLLKDTQLNDEQKDWLKTIENSGENLLVIINDILDFSKLESGKIIFEETEIDIAGIVQKTCTLLSPKAKDKKIPLIVNIDPNLPQSVLGDSVRLNQALLNLISNGIKFTHHGYVTCNVSLESESESSVKIKFEVIDTGIGIHKDKLNLIFERFSQVNSNTTRKFGGTGLGLTITKKIIEQQGGTISVTSNENEGSTFSFTLPFKIIEPSIILAKENHQEKKDFKISTANLKLLLVEDNLVNQKLAKAFLSKWDIATDVADNGIIALDLLEKNRYDIILMDLQMPELDGYETTKRIRSNHLYKHIPIVAMTAHAFKGEIEKCIKIGMNDYISKPFSPSELLNKIEKYTNSAQTALDAIEMKSEFNMEYIKELSGGSSEFLFDIINLFLSDTPILIEKIKANYAAEDWGNLKLSSHKLKSSMGMFGLMDCMKNLSTIEEYCKSMVNLSEISPLIDSVSDQIDKAIEILKIEVKNYKPVE